MLTAKHIAATGVLTLGTVAAIACAGCGGSLPTWQEIIIDHVQTAHAKYTVTGLACYEAYRAGMDTPLSPDRGEAERWSVIVPKLESLGCPIKDTPAVPASQDSSSRH